MKFLLLASVVLLTWGATEASPGCSCKCCGAEQRRTSEAYQCALIEDGRFLKPFRHKGLECKGLCQKPEGDPILTSAGDEVDFQRFCFFDCVPTKEEQGATCRNQTEDDTKKRIDRSGNGIVPMKNSDHHATVSLHNHLHTAETHETSGNGRVNSPWGKAMNQDADNVRNQAAALAATAKEQLKKSLEGEKRAKEILDKNKSVIPSMVASVTDAAEAASKAYVIERRVEAQRDEVLEATKQAADNVVDSTLKEERAKAHVKAKKAAREKADKLENQLLENAPKAAAEAMKPYNDALGRAAATAGEYSKRGDAMGSASVGLQMQASMLVSESNQWNSLGETAKAQKLLQQAHQTMDLALGLSGQANSMYNTAQSIMGTLGSYVSEAAQAAYHAEVMVNPDAMPPPAPLVSL